MSKTLVVTSVTYSGVPRFEDVEMELENIDIRDYQSQRVDDQQYFCPQGHSFEVTFLHASSAPAIWECVQCETIAINRPV